MQSDPLHAKRIAAAIGAVFQHMAEEAAVAAAAEAAPAVAPLPPFWAAAGRQEAMLYRSMWQRRIAKTW